jgi:hypothetical protein
MRHSWVPLVLLLVCSLKECCAQLFATGLLPSDYFGTSISLSANGSLLAVGAKGYPGGGDNGAVFTYACDAGLCGTYRMLQGPGSTAGDYFGCSVSLAADGRLLAVGASGVASFAGAVYMYTCVIASGTCTFASTQVASDGAANFNFGTNVAVSGDGGLLAVGATGSATGGAVYAFMCGGTGTCGNQRKITAIGGGVGSDAFGGAVALSGDGSWLAVGAIGRTGFRGIVFVYRCSGSTCLGNQSLTDASGVANSYFGTSLAFSSDGATLAVGSPGGSSANASVSTYACVVGSPLWTQRRIASPGPSRDSFGGSLAFTTDGSTLLVGADGPSSAVGKVYTYSCSGAICSPLAESSAGAVGDKFGTSVATSADASVVVIGATGYNSQTGIAYIFAATLPTSSATQSQSRSMSQTPSCSPSLTATTTSTVSSIASPPVSNKVSASQIASQAAITFPPLPLVNGTVSSLAGRQGSVKAFADGYGLAAAFNGPTTVALNAAGTIAFVVRSLRRILCVLLEPEVIP